MLSWGNATDTLVRSGTHAVISTGISTAIKGGSFSSNLGSALVNEGLDLATAAGNRGVGDLAQKLGVDPGTATTMLLHATLGGLISVAKGQDFTCGAIAGGVAEGLTPIVNGLLAEYVSDQKGRLHSAECSPRWLAVILRVISLRKPPPTRPTAWGCRSLDRHR